MGAATAVVVVLMLLCATFAVLATIRAARAVNRGVERASHQVRRGIDDTTIRLKATQPGVVGQVARVRMEMRASIDTARRELTAGVAADASLRESLALLDQLHEHARVLDRELAGLMDREPDRARVAARLPEVRTRAEEIKESADALRLAAQDRARRHDVEGLASLREQINIESGALRHWAPVGDPDPADPAGHALGEGGSGQTGGPRRGPASGVTDSTAQEEPVGSGSDEADSRRRRAVEGSSSSEDGGMGRAAKWDVGALWDSRRQWAGFRQSRDSRDAG